MSDFERDLIQVCMTECLRVQGDLHACTETTHVIASVLGSAIAVLMGGNEAGAVAVARIIADEFPEMARQRAVSFRKSFGGPDPNGGPQ